jgi:hypothetical protein
LVLRYDGGYMPPFQQQQYPQQQPAPQPPQDQYHFIMNPEQPKRSSSLKNPMGLLFIVGAVAVVVVLLVVILSIARGGGSNKQPLITVAQDQQEIGRVAALDLGQIKDQRVKNFATTTQLTMATDSISYTSFLGKHGVKVSKKQLSAGTNSSTDAQLASAITSNTLDSTLSITLQNELKQYQTDLAKAYQSSTTSSVRAELNQLNQNADLLLTQSQQ